MSSPIAKAFIRWKEEVLKPALSKLGERKDHFATSSGIPIDRLQIPNDTDDRYLEHVGFPGSYPFTRGVQPTMYRGRLWTMRQYAGYASAEETNRRFHTLLERGQTGLSVAFDLPTQIGLDADHSLASGEVGRVGVSISSILDMEQLFGGIPLDQVSTSMTINAPAAILLAMYIAVARRQGVDTQQLRGTIQNDILKEYIARGTYIFPPTPALRLITDVMSYCHTHVPRWNTISISGYHIREAGSTAVQEVAFTLANGIAYIQAALKAGLQIDSFAPQLAFFFSADNDFLEEIAKYRASRRLWARIMRDRFEAKDEKSWRLRFHTQTGGSTLTAQQPENNVVRVALQALAAVLGGTQSLHTNSKDEALGLPSEEAAVLALRTQQIIAHETGVADTIDPMAGSYVIEYLTDQIEERAAEYIDRIDALGGALRAIETGFQQSEILDAAYQAQIAIETEEAQVVGINTFREDHTEPIHPLRIDLDIERQQRARLEKLKSARDGREVKSRLAALSSAANGDDNMMEPILECVEAHVTLGEICDNLRQVWGEYQPGTAI
jgi:methylmalonyl-CoA mutase N-terminal domain/subunit